MKTKILILFLLLAFITTTGFGCKGGNQEAKQALLEPVELTIWGIFDTSDGFKDIIAAYKLLHPNVKINYYKFRWEEYEKRLLDGWAEDTGPDIFVIHNTWIGKYQNKILPMPTKIQLPIIETSGWLKKDKKAVIKEFSALTPNQVKNIFPDVVYQDVIKDNLIYALPLSIDTLSLFYNRDHLNAAGIANPPATWEELTEAVKKLTLLDESGEIVRSAIAMGGADNINRSNDILSLLMLQNGTQMIDSRNKITFNEASNYDRQFYPGEEALRFYTDFALPSKEVYTWNQGLPESLELFSSGKLSMLFGFSYQIPLIKAQAPKISFGIAPIPHINSNSTDALGLPINLASYWSYSVFKRTQHPNEAWDFINFMTTQQYTSETGQLKYYAENYLDYTDTPPALKNLISKYKLDKPDLAPFADQLLTAKNWYHGINPDNMNLIFKQMINNVVTGKMTIKEAIGSAVRGIE